MDSAKRVFTALSFSMATAANVEAATADTTGWELVSMPIATPTRETWARVSAMSEYLRTTRNTPISGTIIEMSIPAAKALSMKSSWNISGIQKTFPRNL